MPDRADPRPHVVVLCPMAIERKAVSRALRDAGLHHVPVIQTGIGKDAVIRAVENLIANPKSEISESRRGDPNPKSLVVLAGACGALQPVDDVPPIARIIDARGHEWRQAPAGVTLIGIDGIVSTPRDKQALAARTGAAIVDMESHAFCAACERRGLAWRVIRGVSDAPDQTLPARAAAWLDPSGHTRPGRAALDMLRRPNLIGPMIGVMRRAGRVLPLVGRAVAAEIRAASAPDPTPIPISGKPVGLLVVGGTFDPPHLGHVDLPRRTRDLIQREHPGDWWLVFVPASRSPLKSDGPVASDADRIAMLSLAIAGIERASIWTDEIDRAAASPGPSFTIDTLRRARAWLDSRGHASTMLRLVIGADQAADFHRWRDPRAIIQLAEPLVLARDDAADADALIARLRSTDFWTEAELAAWRSRLAPVGLFDASATRIRQALSRGDADAVRPMLPPSVLEYATQRNLYTRAPG